MWQSNQLWKPGFSQQEGPNTPVTLQDVTDADTL